VSVFTPKLLVVNEELCTIPHKYHILCIREAIGTYKILKPFENLEEEIQSKYIVREGTDVQHIPSQGKFKENLWLGQTTDDIVRTTVPNLLVPSLPNMEVR
jgi:hypothetical protein